MELVEHVTTKNINMNSISFKVQLLIKGVKVVSSSEAQFMPKPKSPEKPQSLLISMDREVVAECRFSEFSPFRLVLSGFSTVYCGDKIIGGVHPLRAPSWYWRTLDDVDPNIHVGDVFHLAGADRLTIFPWDGCWFYHFNGLACAFCGVFIGTGHVRPRILDLLQIHDYDIWWRN